MIDAVTLSIVSVRAVPVCPVADMLYLCNAAITSFIVATCGGCACDTVAGAGADAGADSGADAGADAGTACELIKFDIIVYIAFNCCLISEISDCG